MILEKTIRKKRISPFYMEVVGTTLYCQCLILISLVLLTWMTWQLWGWYLIFVDLFLLLILTVLAPLCKIPAFSVGRSFKKDSKNQRLVIRDLVIVDYGYSFATEIWDDGATETFLHLFYTEPCIRLCVFDVLPEGNVTVPTVPLKFYLPEVHFTYSWQKDYGKYHAEYEKLQEESRKGLIREDIPKRVTDNEKDLSQILFYMTYEKMQAFNRLFELVTPHEFRITSYESSGVLISIEPIPGKEYPPEALECMEKINAMYP